MKDLLSNIELFYNLIKTSTTELAPSPTFTTPNETTQADISSKASDALIKGGETLKAFLKNYGTDMSKSIPGRAFLYNFPEKPGSTCLFDNHIVHFNVTLIPVEKQERPEMKTNHDSTIKYIVKWLKTNAATTDIKNNPDAMKNVVLNLIGQKGAEGSKYNYNFGFIQVTKNDIPGRNWKGHVFVISDYNIKDGIKVPYIWPYLSFLSFEEGINHWLDFLSKRGFINAAKLTGIAFTEALQKGNYFAMPKKKVIDQATGKEKLIVDEEKAKEVRNRYYKNGEYLRQNKEIIKAINKYVYEF